MSEKREKKRRYNEKLEYIAHFEEWIAEFQKWVEQEPPVWRFIKWHNWLNKKPIYKEREENAVDLC